MKRYPIAITVAIVTLCSVVSTSSFWGERCSAQITIFNKLPVDVTLTVDGQRKKIPSMGSCTEQVEDSTERTVPCSKLWYVNWESSLPFFATFCSSLEIFEEDDDDDDYTDYDDEEEEEVCKKFDVYISVKEFEGLNRSVGVTDNEHEILVVTENGLFLVKNPYLDFPENLQNISDWFESAELHQP